MRMHTIILCLGWESDLVQPLCQKEPSLLTCKTKRSYGTIRRRDDKGAKKIVYS